MRAGRPWLYRTYVGDNAVNDGDNGLESKPRPYRTAESTIDAFWYLVRLNDPDRLEAWLLEHPKDQQTLYALLQARKNEKR